MKPLRIGNDADALTLIAFPRTFLMIGVIREKRHVTATVAGEPISWPAGKVGVGSGFGSVQLIAAASALISRTYSAWAEVLPGDVHAFGLMAAKLAASRMALLRVTQPMNTRPKSMPNRIISITTGKAMANSTMLWPRGSRPRRRPRRRRAVTGCFESPGCVDIPRFRPPTERLSPRPQARS